MEPMLCLRMSNNEPYILGLRKLYLLAFHPPNSKTTLVLIVNAFSVRSGRPAPARLQIFVLSYICIQIILRFRASLQLLADITKGHKTKL